MSSSVMLSSPPWGMSRLRQKSRNAVLMRDAKVASRASLRGQQRWSRGFVWRVGPSHPAPANGPGATSAAVDVIGITGTTTTASHLTHQWDRGDSCRHGHTTRH